MGYVADGISRADAERELTYTLEQVRRGEWRPAAEFVPSDHRVVPTFHEAATDWFEARRIEGGREGRGLSMAAEMSLRWQLQNHLLPHFAKLSLDAIGPEEVDRWRRSKVREGRLNATSINTCLRTLSSILEQAVEYGQLDRNAAKGRRRRLPAVKPNRTYLDRADYIAALLDAAGDLDRDGRVKPYRRALLAVLVLAGLRIDEALRLSWQHVDLARGIVHVPGTKTAAAERAVNLLPLLRDELAAHAAARDDRPPNAFVFATGTGGKQSATNIRRRVLATAVERANARLAASGTGRLPEGLTPHSLRRTFASLLYALGEAPPFVMAQMGHTSPNLALAIYAKEMDRRDGERERLRALVEGTDWATTGTEAVRSSDEGFTSPTGLAKKGL